MYLGISFALVLITSTFAAPIPSERSRGAVQGPARLPPAKVGSGIGSVGLNWADKEPQTDKPQAHTAALRRHMTDQQAQQQAAMIEAQAKAKADALAKAEAKARAQAEAEAKAKAEAEARTKAQAQATALAMLQAQARADAAKAEAMEVMKAKEAAKAAAQQGTVQEASQSLLRVYQDDLIYFN